MEITVVDLSGRITLGEGSVVLRDTVRTCWPKVKRGSWLNLGEVKFQQLKLATSGCVPW